MQWHIEHPNNFIREEIKLCMALAMLVAVATGGKTKELVWQWFRMYIVFLKFLMVFY